MTPSRFLPGRCVLERNHHLRLRYIEFPSSATQHIGTRTPHFDQIPLFTTLPAVSALLRLHPHNLTCTSPSRSIDLAPKKNILERGKGSKTSKTSKTSKASMTSSTSIPHVTTLLSLEPISGDHTRLFAAL